MAICEATDIYSIGAVLFWLLAGRAPTSSEVALGLKFDFRKKSKLCADLSDKAIEALAKIFNNTLCNAPSRRYQRIDDFLPDLEELRELTRPGFRELQTEVRAAQDSVVTAKNEIIEEIDKSKFSLLKAIKAHKGWTVLAFAVILIVAVLFGFLSQVGRDSARTIFGSGVTEFDSTNARYLLLDLQNANHQYEMGLEDWQRLDYTRASKNILEAREEISKQKSQATLDVARVNNSLGCLYLDMGQYEDAYGYLNSAFIAFRNEIGIDSMEARAVKASIARYDFFIGEYERAIQATLDVIEQSGTKTDEQAISAGTGHFLASVYDALGQYDDALAAYENVLILFQEIMEDGDLAKSFAEFTTDPNTDPAIKDYYLSVAKWITLTYNNMGQVSIHKGNYTEALGYLGKALNLSLKYFGQKNPTTAQIYNNAAIAQNKLGNYEKAKDAVELAIAIRESRLGINHPNTAESYSTFADIYLSKGNFPKALQYYADALNISEETLGENHGLTSALCNRLGEYYILIGDYPAAADYLERALSIRKAILGQDHPETAIVYYNLSLAYIAQGLEADAAYNAGKAVEIYELFKGYVQDNPPSFDEWIAQKAGT